MRSASQSITPHVEQALPPFHRARFRPLPPYNHEIENDLLKLELELSDQGPERLSTLLAEDFREFGSSGRTYTRDEIIETLQTEPRPQISIADFQVKILTEGIALVTYRAIKPEGASLRSSLWVIREDRWQILFHQGTREPENPAAASLVERNVME